jgi:predicted nucleic acid-binding protein
MKALFADTFFFVAYLHPRESTHPLADEYLTRRSEPIVTTIWVLVELGNFLSKYPSRCLFAPLVKSLRAEPRVEIIPAGDDLFDRATTRYRERPDKRWSITDCTSFLVMEDRKLRRALTDDHHFEQAGFTILLKTP